MRIDSVSEKPDRAGRYYIKLQDGEILRLYRQTLEDFSLFIGKELSSEELKNLRESAGKMSAKMRAVRIVSASSVSASDLIHRLEQKGETPEDARNAVAWMQDLSLVDDRQTARQIVERCISRGYGRARAKQSLYEKRIPKEYWEEALENYPEQNEKILTFLKQRLLDPQDEKAKKRAIDALLRRGHSWSEIRRAMDKLQLDSDGQWED